MPQLASIIRHHKRDTPRVRRRASKKDEHRINRYWLDGESWPSLLRRIKQFDPRFR